MVLIDPHDLRHSVISFHLVFLVWLWCNQGKEAGQVPLPCDCVSDFHLYRLSCCTSLSGLFVSVRRFCRFPAVDVFKRQPEPSGAELKDDHAQLAANQTGIGERKETYFARFAVRFGATGRLNSNQLFVMCDILWVLCCKNDEIG